MIVNGDNDVRPPEESIVNEKSEENTSVDNQSRTLCSEDLFEQISATDMDDSIPVAFSLEEKEAALCPAVVDESTALTLRANSTQLVNNDEEDLIVCRVCHCEAEEDRPLFHPCKCAGSIKYVHQDCLLAWLRVAGNDNKCELCGEKIMFRNVYAENAPPVLPLSELARILFPKMLGYIHLAFDFLTDVSLATILPICLTWWCVLCIEFSSSPQLIFEHAYTAHHRLPSILLSIFYGYTFIILNAFLHQITRSVWTTICGELLQADVPTAVMHTPIVLADEYRPLREDDFLESLRDEVPPVEVEPPAPPVPAMAVENNQANVNAAMADANREDPVLQWVRDSFGLPRLRLLFCLALFAVNALSITLIIVLPVLLGRFLCNTLSLTLQIDILPYFKKALILKLLPISRSTTLQSAAEAYIGYSALFAFTFFSLVSIFLSNFSVERSRRLWRAFSSFIFNSLSFCSIVLKFSIAGVLLFITAPTAVGWLVDLATLKAFNTTLPDRWSMCIERPAFCILTHWIIGFFALLNIIGIIADVKQLLKPHILPRTIFGAHDLDEIPIRINFSLMKVFETYFIYLGISIVSIALCIVFPLHFGHLLVPFATRIQIDYVASAFEHLPSELLVFHFGIPLLLERIDHRNVVKESIRIFLLKVCDVLHIDDQILVDDMLAMKLLLRDVQEAAASLSHRNAHAFHAEFTRLNELRIVKESLVSADAVYLQFKVAAGDALSSDRIVEEVDHRLLFSLCAAYTIALRKSELALELDLLKLRRLTRFRDSLLSIRQRQEAFGRIGQNGGVNLHILQTMQASFTSLQNELRIVSEKVDLLDEIDGKCRFDDTHSQPSSQDSAAPATAPASANTALTRTNPEVLLNNLFANFLQSNGYSFVLLLENGVEHILEAVPKSTLPSDEIDDSECIVREVVNSIVDDAIKYDSSGLYLGMNEFALDSMTSKKHFKVSEIMSFLISHAKNNGISGLVDTEEELIALLKGVEPALLARFDETNQRADNSETFRMNSNVLLVPFEWRCLLLLCISCISLSAFATVVIHFPTLVGRYCFIFIGMPDKFLVYNYVIGMGILYISAVGVSYIRKSFGRIILNADAIVFAKTIYGFLIMYLKAFLVCIVWLFLIPTFLGLLIELLFFTPLGVAVNETPVFSVTEAWGSGVVTLKMWCKGVLVGILGGNEWRLKLERVLAMGVERIDLQFIFGEVIAPITLLIMDLLLFPYAIGKIATLGLGNYEMRSIFMRYSFICFYVSALFCYGLAFLFRQLKVMHDEVRDSRYLLGINIANRNPQNEEETGGL